MMRHAFLTLLSLSMVALPFGAFAQETIAIDSGDTAWIIIATALVMLMTPGLAFFYSGMVHTNNVVATIMHSFMKLCVISLIWVLWGYSFAFGDSIMGLVGDFKYLGLDGINGEALDESVRIPHLVFVMFQGMFAVITAAIITGAFAERVRLFPILIFSILWVTLVYSPVAHWVWGGGFIASHFEALDFAGGAVVHINSGVAGLVAALMLGRRVKITESVESRPHNLPLTILGGALLWFGWFGFNAGSALGANGLAGLAFANTNIAAAAGAVMWFLAETIHRKKSTSLGIISGAVAGLVAITPAAGFVTPMSSILIGLVGGLLCYWGVAVLKPKLGYDDSLDAFGIHGLGGIWGAIATGIFATTAINPDGADGLIHGNMDLVIAQIVTTGIVIGYSAIATFIILSIIRIFTRVRVSKEEEEKGLDHTEHGEVGYQLN